MSPPVTTSRRPRPHKSAVLPLVAAAVALLAVAALLLLRGAGSKPGTHEKEEVSVPVPRPPVPPPSAATEGDHGRGPDHLAPQPPPPAEPPQATATNDYVKKPGQMMLPNGRILTFPPPEPGHVRKVASSGRIYECDSEGNWRDVTPRQLFHTAFEANFLALSIEGRQFIPAFLLGLDQEEVVKTLQKGYEPVGDETEEELAQIKVYQEMKAAALEYIEQGGTFDQFVAEIASDVKAERRLHAEGMKSIMPLLRERRDEEAKARLAEINAALAEKGYKPVRLPARVRERLGLEPSPAP